MIASARAGREFGRTVRYARIACVKLFMAIGLAVSSPVANAGFWNLSPLGAELAPFGGDDAQNDAFFRAWRSSDWTRAAQLLDWADPRQRVRKSSWHYWNGVAKFHLGRLDEARISLDHAASLRPESTLRTLVLTGRCWVTIVSEDVPGSRAACQAALDASSTLRENIVNMGHYHLLARETDQAMHWYRRSLVRTNQRSDLENGPLADLDRLSKGSGDPERYDAARRWLIDSWPEWEQARTLREQAHREGVAGRHRDAAVLSEQFLDRLRSLTTPDDEDVDDAEASLQDALRLAGQFERALQIAERRLLRTETRHGADHAHTSTALFSLALIHLTAARFDLALVPLQRSAAISRRVDADAPHRTVRRLRLLGLAQGALWYHADAISTLREAVAISERHFGRMHPRTDIVLTDLANLYLSLGKLDDARVLFERSLAISERPGRSTGSGVASSLNNLAIYHVTAGRPDAAIPLLRRALALHRSTSGSGSGNINAATTAKNLAVALSAVGRFDEAQELLGGVLAEFERREGPISMLAAYVRVDLGIISLRQGRTDLALPHLTSALLVAEEQGLDELRVLAHLGLMELHGAKVQQADRLANPALAIWHGKQAIDRIQALRGRGFGALDGDTQRSLIQRIAPAYRDLAGLLVEAGRLAEAQQVTAMLKEHELSQIVRRDAATDGALGTAALSAPEASIRAQYEKLASELAQTARSLRRFSDISALTADQAAEKTLLERRLADGRTAFERYLASLLQAVSRSDERQRAEIERLNLSYVEALQAALDEMGHGGALLHYLVFDDRIEAILTTSTFQRAYTLRVGRRELRQAVHAFRTAIDRRSDVGAQARQLYSWLLEPIRADLETVGVRTLMLSLTDVLRYLPFAALHDGREWMAQRFGLALYTEAARQGLTRPSSPRWQVQAFGLTRRVEGFVALPGVEAELGGIVGPDGLPGQAWLDDQFTAASFRRAVESRPQVLHVASHFVFRPGTETDSFLLLGDGSRLSLQDIKGYSFRGLDLLTLSACDTALGGGVNENGLEIEGFGALAQRRGAGAVLATLWPVSDEGTSGIMTRFYSIRRSTPGITKAAALQRAQVEFIQELGRSAGVAGPPRRPDAEGAQRSVSRIGPMAPGAPSSRLSHPYFWAPFVLMGNWL